MKQVTPRPIRRDFVAGICDVLLDPAPRDVQVYHFATDLLGQTDFLPQASGNAAQTSVCSPALTVQNRPPDVAFKG
jgi:hypothetical protein